MTISIDTAPHPADLAIQPVAGSLGAVISGVDLADELTDHEVQTIQAALVSHRVVFFRDQRVTPQTQLAFASRLGPLTKGHPNVPAGVAGDPRVLELESVKANHWHTDVSFVDRPPTASLLAQVTTPAFGGDTAWANTVAAYESLPPQLRDLADGLDVIHSNVFDYGTLAKTAEERQTLREVFAASQFETVHPAVRVISETGERALFLGGFATRIEGFSPQQSGVILDLLQSHVSRIEHTVRWRWQLGDVALWDNRTTQHTMVDDLDDYGPRHLRRVTIAGSLPVGPDGRMGRSVVGNSSAYTPTL